MFFIPRLSGVPGAYSALPAQFRFGVAGKKDLDPLMALRKGYYKRDLLARQLDKGQICFLGWSGEDLVHARWMFSRTFYVPCAGESPSDLTPATCSSARSWSVFSKGSAFLRLRIREIVQYAGPEEDPRSSLLGKSSLSARPALGATV